jgi:AcrR family transcriptional regulator
MAAKTEFKQKTYRGSTSCERQADRRTRLIEAAIRVYGARGYRSATVKAVCDEAGLTERYFYESFPNSAAILLASFEAVTDFLLDNALQASRSSDGADDRVRAILTGYYATLQEAPSAAKVFLMEIRGVSPEIEAVFNASLARFGRLLVAQQGDRHDSLYEAGIAGAIVQVALAWMAGGFAAPIADVVAAAAQFCLPAHGAGPGSTNAGSDHD